MKAAKQIMFESNMSPRPGYYSGRGATRSDLNYDILRSIATKIEEEHGKEARRNFFFMVQDQKLMSATAFINNLFRLEAYSWVWDVEPIESDLDVGKNGDGDHNLGECLGAIGSMLGGSHDQDDSYEIKERFLIDEAVHLDEVYECKHPQSVKGMYSYPLCGRFPHQKLEEG